MYVCIYIYIYICMYVCMHVYRRNPSASQLLITKKRRKIKKRGDKFIKRGENEKIKRWRNGNSDLSEIRIIGAREIERGIALGKPYRGSPKAFLDAIKALCYT
jgi:hypothetical protein